MLGEEEELSMKSRELIASIILLGVFFISSEAILAETFLTETEATVKFKLWSVEWKENKELLTYKTVDIKRNQCNPQGILDFIYGRETSLRTAHPKIILIKHGIAYVNLEGDPEQITCRSGTSGAECFRARVVFNLTEFDNIRYVYFVDEGDHFTIGLSERIDFWRLMSPSERVKYKSYLEDRLNAKFDKIVTYVRLLQDVGDANTIEKLMSLKRQNRNIIRIGNKEFEELIDETMDIINKRLRAK
jgi:hypothetical protein